MPEAVRPLSVTWLGHSTVLVETDGVRLLTDPLFRSRVGHVRRVIPPPSIPDDVDAALVSHVHYDHLDVRSLRRIGARCIVVPRPAGLMCARRGLAGIVELDEGESAVFGPVTVTATYAEHEAARLLGSATPALGYLIAGSMRIWFAGDTDLFAGMRTLAPGLDVALLPVAGWGPRVGPGHLDPERAAEAVALLQPRVAIPIHWGTYRRIGMARDAATLREPAEEFARRAGELAPAVDVRVLAAGERVELA